MVQRSTWLVDDLVSGLSTWKLPLPKGFRCAPQNPRGPSTTVQPPLHPGIEWPLRGTSPSLLLPTSHSTLVPFRVPAQFPKRHRHDLLCPSTQLNISYSLRVHSIIFRIHSTHRVGLPRIILFHVPIWLHSTCISIPSTLADRGHFLPPV